MLDYPFPSAWANKNDLTAKFWKYTTVNAIPCGPCPVRGSKRFNWPFIQMDDRRLTGIGANKTSIIVKVPNEANEPIERDIADMWTNVQELICQHRLVQPGQRQFISPGSFNNVQGITLGTGQFHAVDHHRCDDSAWHRAFRRYVSQERSMVLNNRVNLTAEIANTLN